MPLTPARRQFSRALRRANATRRTARLAVLQLEDRCVPASFQGLGDLPGGIFDSSALGVSSDGQIVVGRGTTASGSEAFRWSSSAGLIGLGHLSTSNDSQANAASGNGSVVVGGAGQAFLCMNSTGMQGLGSATLRANAVSADGTKIVGEDGTHAFLWTDSTGVVGLGFPTSGSTSVANGISADGQVVIGVQQPAGGVQEAFRWTQTTGWAKLANYPGSDVSIASGISGDGNVIIGHGMAAGNYQAFKWNLAMGTVPQLLGLPLVAYRSMPTAASNDGSLIVGSYHSLGNPESAFIWTSSGGTRDLKSVLASDFGMAGQMTGWQLLTAKACSADGMVIVGNGLNPDGNIEAWIARLDPPSIPILTGTRINSGEFQRSRVGMLEVMFDQVLSPPASAFQLRRQSDNALVPLNATVSGNTVTLTFAPGPAVEFGSLADGRYTLTVLASQINNGNFDGNGDGTPGDDYVLVGTPANGLFRLFGDSNGDGTVNAVDFLAFRLAYVTINSTFDADGDTLVGPNDFLAFRLRYLTSI